MKKLHLTLVLLTVTLISFSQYYVYTAQNNGYWYNPAIWNIIPRIDGVNKHKVIIPTAYTISVDNNVNSMGLGDVEVIVSGGLSIMPNTTLNLSNNSSITLANGVISGTTSNQRINIGSTVKYNGALDGVKTGNSIADNTTGASPIGFRAFATLPVNFTSFYITKSAETIHLNWSTDKEIGNSHFEVERSLNGTDWKKIAVIFGAGNSNNSNNYNHNDETTSSAVVYYRLRQVDLDGNSVYSSIESIRNGETIPPVRIYGSDKRVVIDLNTSVKNNVVVSVLTMNGQVISKESFSNPGYKINFQLHHISTGAYIVQVTDNKGWTEVKKVIL